jgi:hypothetical protein
LGTIQQFQAETWILQSTISTEGIGAMERSLDSQNWAWMSRAKVINIRNVKRKPNTVGHARPDIARVRCSANGQVFAMLAVNGFVCVYSRHGEGFRCWFTSELSDV